MRSLAILLINKDVIKTRAEAMRPVHRHRKFNPKKFTLGQYDSNPLVTPGYPYVKTAKRPYKAPQRGFEQTMYTGQYKRKYRRSNRGRVDDLVRHRKYRHIIEAARAHGDMKTIFKNVQQPRDEPFQYTFKRKGLTTKSAPFLMYMRKAAQRPEKYPTKYIYPRQRLARKTGGKQLLYQHAPNAAGHFLFPENYGQWQNTGLGIIPEDDDWQGMFLP